MQIQFVAPSSDGVIAREMHFGEPEGEFFAASDGVIHYRSEFDANVWFAANDREQFRLAAAAWNNYSSAAETAPEEEQDRLVQGLADNLGSLDLLDREDSLWRSLLEQAEDGLL